LLLVAVVAVALECHKELVQVVVELVAFSLATIRSTTTTLLLFMLALKVWAKTSLTATLRQISRLDWIPVLDQMLLQLVAAQVVGILSPIWGQHQVVLVVVVVLLHQAQAVQLAKALEVATALAGYFIKLVAVEVRLKLVKTPAIQTLPVNLVAMEQLRLFQALQ
jgi:hypothetical protein